MASTLSGVPEPRQSKRAAISSSTLGDLFTLRRKGSRAAPPGDLAAPAPDARKSEIRVVEYSQSGVVRDDVVDVEALAVRDPEATTVTWIQITHVEDTDLLRQLGERFGLHPLAVEDSHNHHQRAKVEHYPEHGFVVLRAWREEDARATTQLCIFFRPGWVMTVQPEPTREVKAITERLHDGRGRMLGQDADYLVYALIDAVVDNVFPRLEELGELLEALETIALERPTHDLLADLHGVRRELLAARKLIWPLRDALGQLHVDANLGLSAETRIYTRDTYDHVVQAIDIIETLRDLTSSLVEVYFASVNTRMNDVMKLLTLITTVFVPLSFIASLYGMNFATDSPWNMPELHWTYGYPFALVLMGVTAVGLLWLFARRGWLRGP